MCQSPLTQRLPPAPARIPGALDPAPPTWRCSAVADGGWQRALLPGHCLLSARQMVPRRRWGGWNMAWRAAASVHQRRRSISRRGRHRAVPLPAELSLPSCSTASTRACAIIRSRSVRGVAEGAPWRPQHSTARASLPQQGHAEGPHRGLWPPRAESALPGVSLLA